MKRSHFRSRNCGGYGFLAVVNLVGADAEVAATDAAREAGLTSNVTAQGQTGYGRMSCDNPPHCLLPRDSEGHHLRFGGASRPGGAAPPERKRSNPIPSIESKVTHPFHVSKPTPLMSGGS